MVGDTPEIDIKEVQDSSCRGFRAAPFGILMKEGCPLKLKKIPQKVGGQGV